MKSRHRIVGSFAVISSCQIGRQKPLKDRLSGRIHVFEFDPITLLEYRGRITDCRPFLG